MTSRTESFRVMMSIYRSLHMPRARPVRIRTIPKLAGSSCRRLQMFFGWSRSEHARPNALLAHHDQIGVET
jgi:hypothetical protein